MSKSIVLSAPDWNVSEIKYMAPKINDKGGKSINIISKQTNRALTISTPLMMTWGISDYVDEKGDSDGKFNISLNFPNDDYSTPSTDIFLSKIKSFENQLLDDAVKNSELWFGEVMSREVVKHMFFPVLKYSKNRDTKKVDLSRPPSLKAKVPNYGGKWNVEIYDTSSNLIFPNENPLLTPIDFVPKCSNVAIVLGVSQVWIGGKGWGCTLKMVQCIVKPREVVSVTGKCHIELSEDDKTALNCDVQSQQEIVYEIENTTTVDDSDDDEKTTTFADLKEPSFVGPPSKKVIVKQLSTTPTLTPTLTPTPLVTSTSSTPMEETTTPPTFAGETPTTTPLEAPKKKMVVKKKTII